MHENHILISIQDWIKLLWWNSRELIYILILTVLSQTEHFSILETKISIKIPEFDLRYSIKIIHLNSVKSFSLISRHMHNSTRSFLTLRLISDRNVQKFIFDSKAPNMFRQFRNSRSCILGFIKCQSEILTPPSYSVNNLFSVDYQKSKNDEYWAVFVRVII